MDEIETFLNECPEASASYAVCEMHYGRLEWLAEHIRRCNFQITPYVARKILAMLEGTQKDCFFELQAVRRSGLSPRAQDPQLRLFRAVDMALDVARRGGFKRGSLAQICFEVGKVHGLSGSHVARQIRPHREIAIAAVEEEEMAEAYRVAHAVVLDTPKTP